MFLTANKKMENAMIEERSLSDCVWSQQALLAVLVHCGLGLFQSLLRLWERGSWMTHSCLEMSPKGQRLQKSGLDSRMDC